MTPLHVLVVDDSAVVRQVMTAILGKEMAVTTAADPLIAMMKMETRRFDVIVLDLEMPRMDGLTFLRKVMDESPLPVVVCSSFAEASSELTMRALQLGAVDVVLKPKVRIGEALSDSAIALIDTVRAAAQARVGRQRAAGPDERAAGPDERAAGSEQRAVDLRPIGLLPTAHCPLPATHGPRPPPAARCPPRLSSARPPAARKSSNNSSTPCPPTRRRS